MGIHNALVTARDAFRNAFAQFDVHLQRRFVAEAEPLRTIRGVLHCPPPPMLARDKQEVRAD